MIANYIVGCILLIDSLLIYFEYQSNYFNASLARIFFDIGLITFTLFCSQLFKKLLKGQLSCVDCKLFKEFPVPMYVFNSDTFKILAVNASALQLYCYSRTDFLQLKASDLVSEGKVKRLTNRIEDNPSCYFDMGQWIHRTKEGEQFCVQVFERETTFGGKSAKLMFAITIEQLITAELKIENEHNEFADILDYISEAFYSVDMDWHFTYVNKEFERLQHRNRADLLGKNVWELFPDGKKLCFYQQYERAIREQVSVHFEEYIPHNEIWVMAHAYPTHTGLAIYFKDITAEKQ